MLDFSQVKFAEAAGNKTVVVFGGFKVSYGVTVDEQDRSPRENVHNLLRGELWNKVYGDLRVPLAELQSIALHEARPGYQHRVQELCRQLDALLARPR